MVSNSFGSVLSSNAFLSVNQSPIAKAGATKPMVISANGIDAKLILNGTRSSDPDGDFLRYPWFSAPNSRPPTLLASGAVAVVVLPVGAHPLLLVVSDGLLSATNAVTVEVITAAQAVEKLITQVTFFELGGIPNRSSPRSRRRWLPSNGAALSPPSISCMPSRIKSVPNSNPPLQPVAASFIQAAQDVIDALTDFATSPSDRPHGKFAPILRQPNGHARLQFSAEPGPTYLLQASTNLVEWGS